MVVPAFGFSVGDFIAAIELCAKVGKSLRTVGGASDDYQHVAIELEGLQLALARLQALEPTESNVSQVNAIRGMALACRLPLQEFLTKIQTYESQMGPWAASSLKGAGKKAKWAVFITQDVQKLRGMVSAKVWSINLLLATHASETLSKLHSTSGSRHTEVLSMMEHQQSDLDDLSARINSDSLENRRLHEAGATTMNDISAKVEDLYMGVQSARTSMSDILTTLTDVSANMALTRKGVSSLQEIGSQIKTLLPTFPRELRGYLRTVLRYNMHMYFTLLDIQKNIATAPTQQLQSNFKFEDALGVTRELPYEWFRHWEPFEGLLRSQFQNTPGEDKVLEGKYLIVHANRPTVAINKGNWGNCITPGAEILMLIVMESISWHVTSCPRPTCDGRPTLDFSGGVMACCPKCGLKYLPQKLLSGPGQDQNISDAIQVLESQIVEDAEVFGHRPLPGNLVGEDLLGVNAVEPSQQDMNAPDMDRGATEPSNIPFLAVKASPSNGSDHASHFPVAEDTGQASDNTSPLHFGPIGGRDHDEEPATGAAPIMRWLQDTSPPEQSTSLLERQREKDQAQQRALEQEANNLEAIRNVFISNAPCPPPDHELASEGMPFGARIYYRNIIDRYPDVPKYLARRLAEANWNRANRLAKVKFPNLANFEEYWREDDTWADESSASTWGEINILQSPADCDPSEREMHRLEAKLAQTINEEGPYERHQHQCTDCFTTFPAIRLLRLHQVLKHSSPGKHTCLECPSSFEDERLYYYHWHLEHSDIANTCPICPAKAQDRHSLEEHIQKEHENSICAAFFQKEDPEAAESAAGRTDDGAPLSPKSAVQTADGIPPMQSEHPKSSDLIQKSESALAKLFGWNLDVLLKGLEKRPATEEPPSQKAPSGWEEAHYPYIADAMRSRVHNETAPDYWTGSRRRHSRSASLYSSRNSSLHGSDQFDAREQSMIIYNPVSDSDGGEFDFQLPSPPVPLGAITRFICDICGKELEIRRKRDWRKHVLKDLRPYCCIVDGCAEKVTTFSLRRHLLDHLCQCHGWTVSRPSLPALQVASAKRVMRPRHRLLKAPDTQLGGISPGSCPFCQRPTTKSPSGFCRHLGRHMELISYAVIPKSYEPWTFYDGSSSDSSVSIFSRLRKRTGRQTQTQTKAKTKTKTRGSRGTGLPSTTGQMKRSTRTDPDSQVIRRSVKFTQPKSPPPRSARSSSPDRRPRGLKATHIRLSHRRAYTSPHPQPQHEDKGKALLRPEARDATPALQADADTVTGNADPAANASTQWNSSRAIILVGSPADLLVSSLTPEIFVRQFSCTVHLVDTLAQAQAPDRDLDLDSDLRVLPRVVLVSRSALAAAPSIDTSSTQTSSEDGGHDHGHGHGHADTHADVDADTDADTDTNPQAKRRLKVIVLLDSKPLAQIVDLSWADLIVHGPLDVDSLRFYLSGLCKWPFPTAAE